jgi:hypothetical protein
MNMCCFCTWNQRLDVPTGPANLQGPAAQVHAREADGGGGRLLVAELHKAEHAFAGQLQRRTENSRRQQRRGGAVRGGEKERVSAARKHGEA